MLTAIILLLSTGYLALQNSWVQTKITNKIAKNLSERLNTSITVGKVDIGFFNKLYLEDVLIKDQNKDTLLFSHIVTAQIDTLKFRDKRISVDKLSFHENRLNLSRDSANVFNFSFLLDAIGNNYSSDTLNFWNIYCNRFEFGDLNVSYENLKQDQNNNIAVYDLDLDISNFHSISDSLSFRLHNLSFNDGKTLALKSANADVNIHDSKVQVYNMNMESSHSKVLNTNLDMLLYTEADSMNVPFDIRLRIGESAISFRELGELVPSFKGMDQTTELSGLIYGDFNDLKGKNLVLKTGMETYALLDFYVNDLMHPEEMYLFLDLKQSETSFTDISNIRFPDSAERNYFEFPENFYEAGLIKFSGNFSGFLSDFVTFGTLESEMGTLKTDILVMPEKDGLMYYRGSLSTESFELGKLLKQPDIGQLTFSGSADGNYDRSTQAVSGVFKGDINDIGINNYTYKNIEFDGILLERMFDGLLRINDPNLQFTFLGELDLNKEVPRFDFNLNLKKAKPTNLNLGESFPDAEIAFKMMANFDGNQFDNLKGAIRINEGYYKNRNGTLDLGGMELKTNVQDGKNELLFNSQFFDATIKGRYHFGSILNSLYKIAGHYIPSIGSPPAKEQNLNNFNYQLNIKEDINALAGMFLPELQLEAPFLLYGQVDAENHNFQFNGSIPGIRYGNFLARDIFIGNQKLDGEIYASKFRISEVLSRKGIRLYNFTIDSKVKENAIDNAISWSNFDDLTYSGNIRTRTTISRTDPSKHHHIRIKGLPSQIYIADTLWSIAPFVANIDSTTVAVEGFEATHNEQVISAYGKLVRGKSEFLNLSFRDIDLAYLDKYLEREVSVEGKLNGTIGIAHSFSEPVLLSNLEIDKLKFKDELMGDISLISKWNRSQSTIDSELKIMRNGRQSLNAFGYFKPSTRKIQYQTEVDSVSLVIMKAFLRKNFSDFVGYGSGKVEIGGTLDKIALNGALYGRNAGLTVDVTQIPYHFNDSVYFRNDSIIFDNIRVYDDQNNTGIFDGSIVHTNFKNVTLDLNCSSEKIRALNTTAADNDQFYGTAILDGRLNIKGVNKKTKLSGTATTLLGTDIKISMESESTVEQYDFIEFIVPEVQEEFDFFEEAMLEEESEFDLECTIEATPEAKVQLIYNSYIGDIIKAQGEGILLYTMDSKGNMTLSGNYNLTKGDYLFTLQNVFNKRFTIEPGGSIIWSGDPYNAIIDLNAIYKLKASLFDLYVGMSEGLSATENNKLRQRIQVECIINLEDELLNPTIKFDINFPNADERDKDDLMQFFNTEEEMNKQILSLIVMGKFYTPDYLRNGLSQTNTNALGATASELLSNQLSNWLSQIDDSWDFGINYRPGYQATKDEIELALSTQLFNDRVTLNGNIGNNTNQSQNNNSSQIVGDVEVRVKLVPSGKIQLKAYNRSNNNVVYETAPYTQGVGLSFKEEYDTLDELFRKMTSLFRKKKD